MMSADAGAVISAGNDDILWCVGGPLFRWKDHDPLFKQSTTVRRMLPAATPATTVNATKAWSYDAPEDRTGEEVGTLVG